MLDSDGCGTLQYGKAFLWFVIGCAYVVGLRQVLIAGNLDQEILPPFAPTGLLTAFSVILAFYAIPWLSRKSTSLSWLVALLVLSLVAYVMSLDPDLPLENTADDSRLWFAFAVGALFVIAAVLLAPRFVDTGKSLDKVIITLFAAGLLILVHNTFVATKYAVTHGGDTRRVQEIQREFSYFMIPLSFLLMLSLQSGQVQSQCITQTVIPVVAASVLSFFNVAKNVYSTLQAEFTAGPAPSASAPKQP